MTAEAVGIKERPILFSGEMVRAILDRRKTQTRRVVKPQPNIHGSFAKMFVRKHPFSPSALKGTPAEGTGLKEDRLAWCGEDAWGNEIGLSELDFCPLKYGQQSDRLWVCETFCPDWAGHGPIYKADGGSAIEAGYSREPRWKPSMHMPRKYSRITLEITGVRVERLQDISEADAKSEGSSLHCRHGDKSYPRRVPMQDESDLWSYKTGFANLWESINGAESWAANPWVWVISFRRIP